MYQDAYAISKKIIKKDSCTKFYDASRLLHLETDTAGVSIGAGLLQVREGMNCGHDKLPDNATFHLIAFTSKSIFSVVQHYSNTEQESLGILHGLEKFHHYSFVKEVCTDQKVLVAGISKNVDTLSSVYSISCCTFTNIGYAFYSSWVLTYTQQTGYPKAYRNQGQENYWHGHKCACHQVINL